MDKLREQFDGIHTLRDVQIQQPLHYPTVQVSLDRERAGLSGVTARDVGESLIAATYSSRYTSRNYWRDEISGNSYQVQVQVPPPKMTAATDVELVPLTTQANRQQAAKVADSPSNPTPPLLVRDVARVMRGEMPGEIDRYNMRRYLSLTANVEGEDFGRVVDRLDAAMARAGQPPRGIEVDLRGQVRPMKEMFRSLEIGLAVAVMVILIMLTGYFQSFRLALSAVASVPAVLAGVVLALWITRTTLNIESFMGAIMAVGVAVSNAIMLVSFGDRHRLEEGMPADRAAITAAKGRLRPIIMTGCAMVAGMIPMSLGLEEGSEQNAPLGRAVIGGMVCATFATLLVLPAVFTLLLGRASNRSPSLDPDDPASSHYDPVDVSHGLERIDDGPAGTSRRPCLRKRRPNPMAKPASELRSWRRPHIIILRSLLLAPVVLWCGCTRSGPHGSSTSGKTVDAEGKHASTAGISVIRPERRDMRMTVVQPGTIEAFETSPLYSRIAGYVQKYRVNIGDRVKAGDVLLDMWIPDFDEQLAQKSATVKRADVNVRVTESALRAADAKLETAKARIISAEAGVKRAQASSTRWESEYKRLEQLVASRVLDVQVRDETYRQFEEAAAALDQARAMVSEMNSARDQATADRDRARVDVEAAQADLEVARANEREAHVIVEYGRIKAPFNGVITQRNVSPGDYLQPGGGSNGRPLFVLEQTDPVRVFVGVPELASFFIHDGADALIRFQALAGVTRKGKVVRSGFSLNPSTRTLQTEIDVPNADGHLHPGWYTTVNITIDHPQVWALPSNAIGFGGQENYYVYLQVDGKPVRTQVIIGLSDDAYTELRRKSVPNATTDAWPTFDGTEQVLVGNLEILDEAQATGQPPRVTTRPGG